MTPMIKIKAVLWTSPLMINPTSFTWWMKQLQSHWLKSNIA
jgi:hypothetical protein